MTANDHEFIVTRTGRKFRFPVELRPEDVDVRDIIWATSNVCRFAGHVRKHYSVATHQVLVHDLAEMHGASDAVRRACLLHDASEAYLGDVPSPLKRLLPQYQEMEARVEAAVRARFGLSDDPAVWQQVKRFDVMALHLEASVLFHPVPDWVDLNREVFWGSLRMLVEDDTTVYGARAFYAQTLRHYWPEVPDWDGPDGEPAVGGMTW